MLRPMMLSLVLSSSPALAGGHYHAAPIAKPTAEKLVLRDTIWSCGAGGCTAAAKSNSRPTIVCEVLAKEVGTLRSFSAGGQPLSAEQLEKCNARAG